jgi:hypothetical protein
MPIDLITTIPTSDEEMEGAPPHVREIGHKVKALIEKTRAEKGERFTRLVEFLYSLAQLRMFVTSIVPDELGPLSNVLVESLARSADRMMQPKVEEVQEAGAIAQVLVELCLVRHTDSPDRRH